MQFRCQTKPTLTERTMNPVIDPKALVKTSHINLNHLQTQLRAQSYGQSTGVGFQRALTQAQQMGAGGNSTSILGPQTASVSVQSGDTLSGIVRQFMASSGKNVSQTESMRLAQEVARGNNLANANLIYPGQRINLSALQQALNASPADVQNTAGMSKPATPSPNPAQTGVAATAQVQLEARGNVSAHPVLDKTLERAVTKGFIPPHEKQAVMDKILQLSKEHKFKPDDFARLTLMESDGMNPRSTNNRCHGIIQFCDGPDRGAASAGFGQNPRAILGHSVLQQLDMVSKYFDDTGLKNFGPAGLDDLYLTVLTPAARNEPRTDVSLNIAGPQAPYLHVNRDTKAPITRASILQGLHQNANDRLGLKAEGNPAAAAARAQAIRVSAYQANNEIR
ncbi:MAG: LysM domain-containing protein [Betaproteobacteria bacterium]|nr:LysM domain-containing protein [Betaproteobacteria bacterium]